MNAKRPVAARRRLGLAGAVPVMMLAACGTDAGLVADRADVVVRLASSGTVEVEETYVIRATAGPLIGFERHVRVDGTDRIDFVAAALDGVELGRGGETGDRVSVRDGSRLDVAWSFAPSDRPVRTFALRYRASAAVSLSGTRGSLTWPVIEAGRPYSILEASIVFECPDGVGLFEGSGIAEAGWTVEARPNGIAARRSGLGPDETGTVVAEVPVDRARIAEPVWQVHRELERQLAPAFVSGGIFIVVVGAGILWLVRFQYGRAGRGREPRTESERETVRSGLRSGGYVCVVLAAGTAGAAWLTLGHLGIWPMALPASILMVGVAFAGLARRIV